MAKITGVVKWFDGEKGYGFISCNKGDDVFVHHSQVKEKGSEKFRNGRLAFVEQMQVFHFD